MLTDCLLLFQSRVPASPPVPSNHSNFAPGMRPPLVSRQLAQDPRQPQVRNSLFNR